MTKVDAARKILEQGHCVGIRCYECGVGSASKCTFRRGDGHIPAGGVDDTSRAKLEAAIRGDAYSAPLLHAAIGRVVDAKRSASAFTPGTRVVRGPDWKSGDQDGGGAGTVEGPSSSGWVCVKWDSGKRYTYRVGAHGKMDLGIVASPEENAAHKILGSLGLVVGNVLWRDGASGKKHLRIVDKAVESAAGKISETPVQTVSDGPWGPVSIEFSPAEYLLPPRPFVRGYVPGPVRRYSFTVVMSSSLVDQERDIYARLISDIF